MRGYPLRRPALATALGVFFLSFMLTSGCAHKKIVTKAALAPDATLMAEAIVEMDRTLPVSGKARIYAQGPDSFRIEVKGPFSQVVALLASDGYTLHTFANGVERYYPVDSPEAPLPFSSSEIVSVLMGTDLKPLRDAGFEIEADGVGHPAKAVKQIKGADGGVVTVLFSDYRNVGGFEVPFEISIQGPRLDKIRIRYSSVELGNGFDEGFFDIEASGLD